MKILLLLLCCAFVCESSNVLVVFPVPERSHGLQGESIVKILLDGGHEVTFVTPFPRDIKWPKLEYVDISSLLKPETDSDEIIQAIPGVSDPKVNVQQSGSHYASRGPRHAAVQELMINTTTNFDAVIAEWFYSGLLAPLASIFECPLIWYTTADVSRHTYGLVHGDSGLDFIAHTLPSPTYSLPDRIRYLWSKLSFGVRNYYHFSSVELPEYEICYRDAFRFRRRVLPNYESLVYNGSLLLINSHPPLGENVPLPLNAQYVGGHHIDRAVSPLPKNIKKLLDESKTGVIYVNLESYIAGREMSGHIVQELIEIFGLMQQTVIWKYDEIIVNLPHNVFMLKKPPQNGILNHPNTIAYISHGQMLSIVDAINFGVPIVGIPVLEDQMTNMNAVERRGCGIRVDFTNEFARKVKDAVNTIHKISSYRMQSEADKLIFRNRVATPQAKVLHSIQLVLETGGADHARSSTLLLSIMERHNLDVIILVLMLFWFLTRVAKLLRVYFVWGEEDDDKKEQ